MKGGEVLFLIAAIVGSVTFCCTLLFMVAQNDELLNWWNFGDSSRLH